MKEKMKAFAIEFASILATGVAASLVLLVPSLEDQGMVVGIAAGAYLYPVVNKLAKRKLG